MSQTPTEPGAEDAAYQAGWAALSRLLRRGWSWSGHERDVAFLNLGGDGPGARFADVSAAAGLDLAQDGRAAAVVDWDADGDQDLVVTSRTGPRVRVLRNDQRSGNDWLAVRLEAPAPNTAALGARVELRLADGRRRVATRRAGEGFLAQSSAWLHFGLGRGEGAAIEELRVRWPASPGSDGGGWESFGAPRAGRFLILLQGAGRAREWPAPSVPALAAGAPAPAPAAPAADLVPQAPIPLPALSAATFDGRAVAFLGVAPGGQGRGTGRPLLLVLWSHTCAPCAAELTRLGERAADLQRASLDVVALSVDPPEERAAAEAFAVRTRFEGTLGLAPPETIAVLDALVATLRDSDRRLGVPVSFLVDSRGRLQVVYLGPVDPERVLRDLVLETLPEEPRRFAAVPFAGRFNGPPPGPDLAWLEAAMRRRGLAAAAAEFAQGRVETRTLGEAEMAVAVAKARLQQARLEEAQALFLQATALGPELPDAWKGLGYCRHRTGDLAGAREAYARAAELDPGDDRNRVNLGLVLVELGDREGARAELARLEARGSEHAATLRRRLEER